MGSSLLTDGPLHLSLVGASLIGLAFDWVSYGSAVIGAGFADVFAQGLPVLLAETSFLTNLANNAWLGLQVALGLGFVIFVHELGHFLAAKTFGVRCDKFYVGFDVPLSIGPIKLPSTLGKFQWGETEYGIGIIPLGGYVKMLGQDDDPRKAEEEAAKLRLGEGEDAPLDPRSYPAKPVWQRMIIISAGVVMNLIFAVILAGAAYWIGVPYTPTVAGSTYAGGPAWEAGIEPGDQVLQAGSIQEDTEKFRYDDFATEVVTQGFESKDKEFPIVIRRGEERIPLTTTPTPRYYEQGFYAVGLSQPTTPTIATPAFAPDSFLAETNPDLQPGDVVVAVEGEELPVSERFQAIIGSELTSRLQAKWEKPVSVTVERKENPEDAAGKKVEVDLPPVPVKSMGIGFAVGPVSAIQKGSMAESAGIQVGDIIETVNGEAVDNALELPSMVGRLAGQTLTLGVRRGTKSSASPADEETAPKTEEDAATAPDGEMMAQGELLEIELGTAPAAKFDPVAPRAGELTLGGIGIAFEPSAIIKSVDEENAGAFQVGDELVKIKWIVTKEEKKEMLEIFRPAAFEPLVIDETFTIAGLYDQLQGMPVGAKISCAVRRDGKISDQIYVNTAYADNWYWHQRGIGLSTLTDIYVADNLVSAARLGLWETSRRFQGVLNFLKLLVTGRVGANALGGPGRIAYVAAAEANQGPSRLMIFLTMLSANLAILNFLPIPALDGGHMVFLTAEAIRGKPVSEALQVRLTMLGVLSLLSLMAFVIVKDIMWFAN